MPEQEKLRKYPRVGLGADSAIWSEVWQGQISEATPVGGVLTVLGAGGAFVEVTEAYDVGSEIGLRFVLPGTRDEIACDGVVREFVPGRGIGVEFVNISPIDRERVPRRRAEPRLARPTKEPEEGAPRRDQFLLPGEIPQLRKDRALRSPC